MGRFDDAPARFSNRNLAADAAKPDTDAASAAPAAGVVKRARETFFLLTLLLLAARLLPLPDARGEIAHIPAFCPFRQITGLPCPGCGLTRAFVFLAHGQFFPSLAAHPLGPFLFALTLFFWLRAGLIWAGKKEIWTVGETARKRLTAAFLTLILTVGIGRIVLLIAHE